MGLTSSAPLSLSSRLSLGTCDVCDCPAAMHNPAVGVQWHFVSFVGLHRWEVPMPAVLSYTVKRGHVVTL